MTREEWNTICNDVTDAMKKHTRPTAITRKTLEQAAADGRKLRSGYALPPFPPSGILILIDADLSP